jgi:molybdenum cofactor synthesis domain-containing protein
MNEAAKEVVTAAVLVIGDEILSGRTKDKNIGHIADVLAAVGIDLCEVRIVPDVEAEIVAAVNALRTRYDYLFTTGGIGPTHDDITAESVAKAFGVPIAVDARARALLLTRIAEKDLNEARLRMARIPQGADLIFNKVSAAPGFHLGNVYVMAGIPAVMQAMLDAVLPTLKTGAKLESVTLDTGLREGDLGTPYGEIQKRHPEVMMGSYPFFNEKGFFTRLVLRGRDAKKLSAARHEVEAMVKRLQAEKKIGA